MFMSAAAQAPAPTPDPPRVTADMPAAIGRVLSVVRRLIDYGRQLAAKVQQRAAAPGFALFARPFGTADLTVILARIISGLRRAAALETRLCQRAASGRDLVPIRLPAIRAARQSAPPDVPPEPQPVAPTEDPRLARLPTEAEIAAEVRRRPIGAVIVDICRDLGIGPGRLDRAFWEELQRAIILYGGSLVRFVDNLLDPGRRADDPGPRWPAAAPRSPTPATGPP